MSRYLLAVLFLVTALAGPAAAAPAITAQPPMPLLLRQPALLYEAKSK